MALSATLKLIINATQSKTSDLSSAEEQTNVVMPVQYSDGAGANQADRMFSDRRTLAASADEDLDLSGGSLADIFGTAFTVARIKAVAVRAAASNTNNVQVTRPADTGVELFMAAGDGISLAPGDFVAWASPGAAGKVVTAGTGDILNIANSSSGSSVEYEIVIIAAAT